MQCFHRPVPRTRFDRNMCSALSEIKGGLTLFVRRGAAGAAGDLLRQARNDAGEER